MIAGSRSVAYPTIKFNEHWFLTGALQLVTRPYYYEDLSTTGYGAKGSVLQATLNYSRVSQKGSILLRAGQMPTAFGSFLLRYDDNDNALVDHPVAYGYYYSAVSILGGPARSRCDAGKIIGRIQFANSSPANPRSISHTINMGTGQRRRLHGSPGSAGRRSGYRGPYLDRKYAYYFPGEVNPGKLPAHAIGLDGNWAHGHTTAFVEVQRFVMPYTVIPDFRESAGYAEMRQVLAPRWFVAGRYSLASTNATGRTNAFETAAGYRPDRFQLLKVGYEFKHSSLNSQQDDHVLGIQFITTFQKAVGRE
jgi:hypothetical protein